MTSRYVTLWWGRKDVPPTGLRSKLQQAKNSIQNAGDILHLRLQFLALWDRSGASKTFDGFGRLDDRAKELSNRLRGVERRGPKVESFQNNLSLARKRTGKQNNGEN